MKPQPKTSPRYKDHSQRRRRRHCIKCGNPTREGKPYCLNHIEDMPYVGNLVGEIEKSASEFEKVVIKGGSAIDLEGNNVKELLSELQANGPLSVPRLARNLNWDKKVTENYVKRLAKANKVIVSTSRRDKDFVGLIGQQF